MIKKYRLSSLLSFLVVCVFSAHSIQAQTVTGTVTDEVSGDYLPGVNIVVMGTEIGTSTGSNGEFEIDVPSLKETLVISFIGYQTREVPIDGQQTLNITLQPQVLLGDELMVVAYGVQRKSDVTGSISSANAEEFNQGIVSNPGQLLQGELESTSLQPVESPGHLKT